MIDLTGRRFGKLIVVSKSDKRNEKNHRVYWNCKCDCGEDCVRLGAKLRTGRTISCGCMVGRNHIHNLSKSREYRIWHNIKNRCLNQKNRYYKYYGGRGITICEKWRKSFNEFIKDVGRQPTKDHTIDRINSNGNYEPANVRWATMLQQQNNRTNNIHINYLGSTLTVLEAAKISNIKPKTIIQRIRSGWSVEDVMTRPIRSIQPNKLIGRS